MLAQRVGLADAVDPDDRREVPGPAGLYARQRVLEHGGLRRLDAEAPRALDERVRLRLARQALLLGNDAVDARLDQRRQPGHLEHLRGVRARGDHGAAQAGVARRLQIAARPLEHLHPLLADLPLHGRVLAIAELAHEVLLRVYAAGLEERRHAVVAGLAVDVALVVARRELGEAVAVALAQVVVEHLLPGAL